MPNPVITVENICKEYIINHEKSAGQTTIREELSSLFDNRQKSAENSMTFSKQEIFRALDDVSFKVEAGTCLGIIGKNGAGKSTLLKILSRITTQTSGRIVLDGRVASLLEVGTGFHGDLTGRENVFLNGAILGMKRNEIRKKFDEIVAFAEVEKFLDTPVKKYSSGMYMRLAFSIAAHLEPEILLVDEVLAVGDHEFQKKCLGKMEEVSQTQGRTILFVSHNMDAVRSLCNRAIILQQGKLMSDSSVSEAVSIYLNTAGQQLENHFPYNGSRPSITSVSLNQHSLQSGKLELQIGFRSPFELHPIPGFVVYNALNVPVFGSNPRFHREGYSGQKKYEGTCTAVVNDLNLHSGHYLISVWLGDMIHDYDHKPEAVSFDYQNNNAYSFVPDPLLMGAVDKTCRWSVE